jgi:hypothetical protein
MQTFIKPITNSKVTIYIRDNCSNSIKTYEIIEKSVDSTLSI